jgi:hypothetical protein
MKPPRSLYRLRHGEGRSSMERTGGWIEKRRRIRLDLAREFSARAAIAAACFLRSFYDAAALPSIREFQVRYVPDAGTLDEILAAVASRAGLSSKTVKAHFSGNDTFPSFGERLLRAGAYDGGAR